MDGVRLVRAGRQWTVHWAAYRHYLKKLSNRFDIVVDEVNTIPFFTPLWSEIPTVMFIHQLARDVWWYESPFPLSALGYVAEPIYLRAYRTIPVITVSPSTALDLKRLGFKGSITVVPEGVEPNTGYNHVKSPEPTFLFVGRMAPSKRVEDIIKALALFRRATGKGTLSLVGSGSDKYQRSLRKLAARLGVADSIAFRGRVTSAEKFRLMASAQSLLVTSVREGWGLVVSEASACGTPAIVYDVPGLRDSVRTESTGLVVEPRPASLSDAMVRLSTDPALYGRLANEGRRWTSTFSFDEAARIVSETLNLAIRQCR